jgi:hypothetical protein
VGKGCVKYANPERIVFDVIATKLREALDEGPVC